jgi:hypothetical protein
MRPVILRIAVAAVAPEIKPLPQPPGVAVSGHATLGAPGISLKASNSSSIKPMDVLTGAISIRCSCS